MAERDQREAPAAVIRVEQLYPFPPSSCSSCCERYPNARELVWLQEEPENMGAWHFIESRTWRIKERGYDLRHVARVESGSPATGLQGDPRPGARRPPGRDLRHRHPLTPPTPKISTSKIVQICTISRPRTFASAVLAILGREIVQKRSKMLVEIFVG